MDILAVGIGFALGVIVYTLLIYIAVKRLKKKRLNQKQELLLGKENKVNERFIVKTEEDKHSK